MNKLIGKTIKMRFVEDADAPFILQLRLDDKYNQFLSSVSPDVDAQKSWIKRYKIETNGKNCVIIGRSNIVGRPLSVLMSQKAVNAERSNVGVLSQVDGARWLSLEGVASVNRDPEAIRDAELRYAQRYRTPRANPRRVVIEVLVKRVLGSSTLLDRS